MSIGTFTTATLNRVVRALEEPNSFLLDLAFGEIQTEDSEEVHFDQEDEARRITPFVSPIREGRVVKRKGFTTKSFTPPYAKDKRVFRPNQPLKRSIGEQIGGELSPEERWRAALAREMTDQVEMLTRLEESMAAEVLRTGAITVEGDGYPQTSVDFGRAAALTVTLSGTDLWSDADSTPVDDLEDWAQLVSDNDGGTPMEVVMAADAWQTFRSKQEVKDLLDTRRGSESRAEIGPMAGIVRQPGFIGDFRIWVYTGTYIDRNGATQKFVPDGTVLLINPMQLEGVRAYAAIQDSKAGFAARRFFAKTWEEEDPAVRWLLLQSAPLVVPYRPNASLAATVL